MTLDKPVHIRMFIMLFVFFLIKRFCFVFCKSVIYFIKHFTKFVDKYLLNVEKPNYFYDK